MRCLVALLLSLAAAAAHGAGTVTVFAAASLGGSLDAAVRAFENASGNKVSVSYGASSALARQIEAGAPADLFISADTDWVDYVEKRGLAASGSRRALLANDLVLIAPAGSTVRLALGPGVPIAQALGDGRIALADPNTVPAGKYAKASFLSMGVWGSISSKLAPAENVRAALALVARGEAPLGVVYRTDAVAERNVRILDTFPAGSHPPIVYPMVTLKHAQGAAVKDLAAYLVAARPIFERFGFRAP